jgi:hypothetical protein
MKPILAIPAVLALCLSACESLNQPITSGDFDPLKTPGNNTGMNTTNRPLFSAGQFVTAAVNNTAFFKPQPKGEMDADKLLPRGTSMKVISLTDTYVKVELDSGEVGFVPSVMVEDPRAASAGTMVPTNPNEFQIYPPPGGMVTPLPPVRPGEQPPDGAIPAVIDPEAPATTQPLPPVTTPAETFPAPPEKKEPAPLPPNGEEEAEKPAEATPKLEQ